MIFFEDLGVFGRVPVHKKHETLAQGPDSLYFQSLPKSLLLYARAFIGRTNGA